MLPCNPNSSLYSCDCLRRRHQKTCRNRHWRVYSNAGAKVKQPEPVTQVKRRRDLALSLIVSQVPYITFLGVSFDRHGDELTSTMAFHDDLIGNPMLPALHGGATAAFLEVTAIVGLAWASLWTDIEEERLNISAVQNGKLALPKTIDLTVDYLRSGLPRDAYARARVNRSGRRYASVHVEGWQDNRSRLFAQATGHFLMPQRDG